MKLQLPQHVAMTLASDDAVQTFGPGGVHEVPDTMVRLMGIKVDDAILQPQAAFPPLGALSVAVGGALGSYHVLGWGGLVIFGLGLLWADQLAKRTKQALKDRRQ